jgi:ABC-type Na+ transport system ATPase subunit NatA
MILTEKNIFEKIFNLIKVKIFINDSNVTFSNEQINEEFLNDNNLTKTEQTPLLQNNIQNENENIINNNEENNGNKNTINSNLVDSERNRIIEDSNKNIIPTKIVGLKKTYWLCCKKNIRAVNNIYFGLEDNEKFGLLGFNGSGKTTTFKSITKEILYDSGILNISNRNINSQFNEIRKTIGYCPQKNPILDYMKVREMIKFFLDLKGIPDTAENVCKKFGLEKYMDTYCENLSSGNKRKLSFALALIGQPRILLLDESSTGVDPESRRIMLKNIINLKKKTFILI